MNKWILAAALLVGCQESGSTDDFDDTLPEIIFDQISVDAPGGFDQTDLYAIAFKTRIVNPTENVFKTFRQDILFTGANGNLVTGQLTLPMLHWLCPLDTLIADETKSEPFEQGFIDSVISAEPVTEGEGLMIVYGKGDECN